MGDAIQLLRETPVDEARLADVRRRVLERVASRRPGPGRWILAGAIGSALLAFWLWPSPLSLEPPAVAWTVPARPPEWAFERVRLPDPPKASGGAPVGARHAEPGRDRSRPYDAPEITVVAVEGQTATVQIPTSNPDVVLYWLIDGGGD